jgi:ABC-type maltose transport system permease subunit
VKLGGTFFGGKDCELLIDFLFGKRNTHQNYVCSFISFAEQTISLLSFAASAIKMFTPIEALFFSIQ